MKQGIGDSVWEEPQEEEEEVNQIPPDDLFSFTELRSCAELVRMYENGGLNIDPDFQRGEVWNKGQKTRFIDSVSKWLPIPSMCISLDYKTRERLVIDGLQRISTIINFLTKDDWRLSKVGDVRPEIAGKTPRQIRDDNPNIYAAIEEFLLPVTILRCNSEEQEHMEYLFMVFHRLNVSGTRLSNQEIRNCLYSGTFNKMITNLVKEDENFRNLLSIKEEKVYRLWHEESVLRFFSFYKIYKDYAGPITRYLNNYISRNRKLEEEECEKKATFWKEVTRLINDKTDGKPLSDFMGLNKARLDGVLIGFAENQEKLLSMSSADVQKRLKNLMTDEFFTKEALSLGAYSKDTVVKRLDRAIKIFGGND